MRPLTCPRPLLLPMLGLALALACSSPKGADAPAAEEAIVQSMAPTGEPSAKSEGAARPSASMPAADAEAPGAPPPGARKDQTRSQIEIAVPMINGGLDRDIIRRTASDHSDELRECHGRALAATPELAGTIVVSMKIDDEGHVTKAELADSSAFTNREVEVCVLALVQGWQFPAPDAGGPVSAELSFDLRSN